MHSSKLLQPCGAKLMNYPDTAGTFQSDTLDTFILLPAIPPLRAAPAGGAWPFYHGRRKAPGLLKRQAKATTHQRKVKKTLTQRNVEQCPPITPSIASMQPTGNFYNVAVETLTITINNVP